MDKTNNTQPINPYLPIPHKVLEFNRETADNFTIKIDMKGRHEPGQFIQVSSQGVGEAPISICSDSENYIELNIREVGNVTRTLSKLKVGDVIFARGPYGKGYPMHQLKGNDIILIGGGCGVAPLKGVLEYIKNHRQDYKDIFLFLGFRSPNDILFRKHLEEWKSKFNVQVTVDKASEGQSCQDMRVGFITEAIKESSLNNKNKAVFICGPPIMMKLVIEILKQKGFNDDQIYLSYERLMYCGKGVCCHCMVQGKFACVDGPVFRYDHMKEIKND
jgi:anaerobic sulfite reductase subunit B